MATAQSINELAAERADLNTEITDLTNRIAALTTKKTTLQATADDYTAAITALGSVPANTAVPTISGTAKVGQTLTAANGTWTGNPAPAFTYQWKKSGVNISGATKQTYVPVTGDIGGALTVTVTGTNALGNASATSTATANVIA